MNTQNERVDYTAPSITDFGSLEELTAACLGTPQDVGGQNNSVAFITSRIFCNSGLVGGGG